MDTGYDKHSYYEYNNSEIGFNGTEKRNTESINKSNASTVAQKSFIYDTLKDEIDTNIEPKSGVSIHKLIDKDSNYLPSTETPNTEKRESMSEISIIKDTHEISDFDLEIPIDSKCLSFNFIRS